MARSLVLGNGSVLVCYDEWGQVRDFHFPQVGLENHVGEQLMHRIGVFVEGHMYWISDGGFAVSILYEQDTLVGQIQAIHKQLGIELRFSDIVYNEHDIYVRHLEVINNSGRDLNIKLFFNQQFHISESERGDTGYYSPELHAIIHYKGRRVFLVSAKSNDAFFDDYSVGLLGIEGKEGTWRDAEDGVLSKSGIEHGSVDSVIGVSLFVRSGSMRTVSYWIAAAESYNRVVRMHRDILTRGPEHLRRTTRDYWKAWVNRTDFDTCNVEASLIQAYHRSLLVMRAHTDNKGAIIASGDSSILQSGRDTYNYCWPRDASYIITAFLHAGHTSASETFHNFLNQVLTEEGYLLHKYRSDMSLGSSWHPWVRDGKAQPPIQEDESAITLISLAEHYAVTRDVEYIEQLYNPYIKRVADFLTRYRDKRTGLPRPSHDLWEEQLGVFTYTASTVYAALKHAAQFAKMLGKEVAHKRWDSAADEVRLGILNHLIREDGHVLKSLRYVNHELVPDHTVDVSSFYGLFKYGVLALDDERLVRAYHTVQEKLSAPPCGGIARYEGDRYFNYENHMPGNPWVLTTLWLAEYEIARATRPEDLQTPRGRLQWALDRANDAGLLAEQYDARECRPTSVMPLVWSHAEYVLTFLAYVDKLRSLGLCPNK